MSTSRDPSPQSNESKDSNKENQKPLNDEIALSFSPPRKHSAPPLSRAEDLSKVFEGDDMFLRRSPPERRYEYRYESPVMNREYGYRSYKALTC